MYYTVSVYLKEDIPNIGTVHSFNLENMTIVSRLLRYPENDDGFSVEDPSFGIIVIPINQIRYMHIVPSEGEMPISTQITRYRS